MRLPIVLILLCGPLFLTAQPSWKKKENTVSSPEDLFQTSQTANLPTAETLSKGDFMYEISHRFGDVTSGYDGLYGLDGPVTMCTALSYGIMDPLMVSIGRSNIQDNLDLRFKYRFNTLMVYGLYHGVAIQAGVAFNTETFAGLKKRPAFDSKSIQYYGQLILNTMFMDKKIGVGIVPSFVYNSYIFSSDYSEAEKYTLSLPVYMQYYFNRMWSLFVEYMPVLGGWKGNLYFDAAKEFKSHNSVSSGLAIDTGGHTFFLFLTNNERLNLSQHLTGAAADPVKQSSWRVAFGIIRIL